MNLSLPRWLRTGATAIATALLLAACTPPKPTLRIDQDRAANFNTYRTYAYVEPAGTDANGYSTRVTQHFKDAIDAEMTSRGYRRVTAEADLLVNFNANTVEKTDIRTTPGLPLDPGLGYYGYRRGLYLGLHSPFYGPEINTIRYHVGTANIEIIDARQKRAVWEGVAEGRLSREAMKNPQQAILDTVRQLFTQFPGRAAGSV